MHDTPAFSVTVLHLDGSARVALVGALDHAATGAFRAAVHPLLARYDGDQVVVDCSALRSVDPHGVKQLEQTSCRGFGGPMHLIGLAPAVLGALREAGVDRRFALHAEHPA